MWFDVSICWANDLATNSEYIQTEDNHDFNLIDAVFAYSFKCIFKVIHEINL